ncbi:MAG: NDP-hexose 4-ketoreductase, partial [Chloroflexi bacterium]
LLLNRVRAQLTEQQIELIVPQSAKDFLLEKGFDAQYGARPLRRTIQRMVEDPLAEGLLQGKFHPGDLVEASVVDDDLALHVRNRIEQLPAPATPEAALSAGGGENSASGETA